MGNFGIYIYIYTHIINIYIYTYYKYIYIYMCVCVPRPSVCTHKKCGLPFNLSPFPVFGVYLEGLGMCVCVCIYIANSMDWVYFQFGI